MNDPTALLICDDPLFIETIDGAVRMIDKLRLRIVASIERLFASSPVIEDAIVLLYLAPGNDGAQAGRFLRMLTCTRQSVPVIVVSEEYRPDQFLELLRLGAADCLSLPFDLPRLSYLIDALTLRGRYTTRAPSPIDQPLDIPGCDTSYLFLPQGAMGTLMEQIQRVAPQNATVLLTGETGTGKTRLARVIHELSPRRDKPFLVINCGSLLPSLIESELFGHVKGAFTGAERDRNGKLADAGGGTLLLDEIDTLPLHFQAKLLRVLEERFYEPVGSNRTRTFHARLIVASNRDLDREVTEGRFRADLYYRLNVVSFKMLPLRERRQMIVPLAERFRAEFANSNDRASVQGMNEETRKVLEAHSWPGNIRELRNTIERAVALCAGPLIEVADLPEVVRRGTTENGAPVAAPARAGDLDISKITLAETKDEAEYQCIVAALQRNGNNRLRTAAELGISRMTLYKKLHQFGLIDGARSESNQT